MAGRWTAAEDAILAREYPKHGPSWEGWGYVLPGRTKYSIRKRARKLGATGGNALPGASKYSLVNAATGWYAERGGVRVKLCSASMSSAFALARLRELGSGGEGDDPGKSDYKEE